jgi:hypothetical protein
MVCAEVNRVTIRLIMIRLNFFILLVYNLLSNSSLQAAGTSSIGYGCNCPLVAMYGRFAGKITQNTEIVHFFLWGI